MVKTFPDGLHILSRALIFYYMSKPQAILIYFELCRMVSSLEESYLSSAGLSPLRTHFIASLENVWYDNYLLRILPTTFARQFHHNSSPNSPLCAHSFQKGQKYPKAPYEIFLSRKAWGNLLSLKEEKEKASTH